MLILHIDDDADDRALFLEAIKRIDVDIHHLEASDAVKGLAMLSDNQAGTIDCVFLDINMPLMDGLSMLKLLKNDPDLRKIPVFIYSTTSDLNEIESVNALGGHFLQKRSDFRGLMNSLKEICYRILRSPQNAEAYFTRYWNSYTSSFTM